MPPLHNSTLHIRPGCHVQVAMGHASLSRHLALTQDTRCVPFRTQFYGRDPGLNTSIPGSDVPHQPVPQDDNTSSGTRESSIFDGDFFGNDYQDHDFPGWEDERDDDDAIDQDLHAAPIDGATRQQWEPAHTPPPEPHSLTLDPHDPPLQPAAQQQQHIQNTEEVL